MKKEDFHTIASTAIIFKQGKVLIAQRNANEKSWPSLWVVPGGKLQYEDYKKIKRNKDGLWYNAVEMSLRREVKEEVGLEIKNIEYICDMTFQREDKTLGMILSFMADWAKGRVKLSSELVDYRWVDLKEAKNYQLIDGIYEEIVLAYKLKSSKKAIRLIYA